MSEPKLDPDLERTAGQVADHETPDWELETGNHPDLRGPLAALRMMARLAAAHREVRRRFEPDRSVDPGAGADDPEQREPAFSWGFLRALDPIGEGSFGEVWRAWDPSLEREVALKLRRLAPAAEGVPALLRTSDPATRYWLDEARKLARVRHPNVLTVHGAAQHEGRAGLWTELVRGESVEARLAREGPLPSLEAARIVRDLCRALTAVHAAGLVHGDVKAANVMLEPASDGPTRVVLMDFGAAHAAGGDRETRGWLAVSTGTPLVMSPEVLRGEPATPAADLYAAGVLLFRLLTGRHPVEAESLDALRDRHERGERLSLAELRPGLPPAFARLIDRALAKRPEDRPEGAAELARALEPLAGPVRGRMAVLAASLAAVALVVAIASAIAWFERPSDTRFVPPERLPGPQVAAMRLGDIAPGEGRGEQFGNGEAGIGDANGDGFADVIVAGAHFSGARYLQGRVALFLGNAAGRLGKPAWVGYGRAAGDYYGAFVAAAGDVNGDGLADALITDQAARSSDHQEVGSVALYLGSKQGLEPEPVSRVTGWQPHARFGAAISGIGDVNGDGYADVAIGASNWSHRHPYEGAVFVYFGGPHGLPSRPDWRLFGGERDAWLGALMTRVGDVNHDGYADLLVGSPGWKGGHAAVVGRALLYLGGPHGLATKASWSVEGDQPSAAMGYAVGGAGDVNRDGYDDVIVLQPGWSGRGVREGRMLLYLGGPHGPSRTPAWTAHGFSAATGLSSGGPAMGDVNGDGLPDLQAGSWLYSASADRRQLGIAAVYLSPREPRAPHPAWYLAGDDAGTPIAAWTAPAGDFNGDGLGDLLVGQSGWYRGDQRGRVLLFLGQRTTSRR